jgi:hypothetical protein
MVGWVRGDARERVNDSVRWHLAHPLICDRTQLGPAQALAAPLGWLARRRGL